MRKLLAKLILWVIEPEVSLMKRDEIGRAWAYHKAALNGEPPPPPPATPGLGRPETQGGHPQPRTRSTPRHPAPISFSLPAHAKRDER